MTCQIMNDSYMFEIKMEKNKTIYMCLYMRLCLGVIQEPSLKWDCSLAYQITLTTQLLESHNWRCFIKQISFILFYSLLKRRKEKGDIKIQITK